MAEAPEQGLVLTPAQAEQQLMHAMSTLGEIQPDIDEFNSRGQAFEAIMRVLCGRIDNLNERMQFALSFIAPTQERLGRAESALGNLAFNMQGFESAVP